MKSRLSSPGAPWLPLVIIIIVLPLMLSCSIGDIFGQTQPVVVEPQVTVVVVVQSPTPELVLPPTDTPEPTPTEEPPEPEIIEPSPTPEPTETPLPAIMDIKNIREIGFHFVNSPKCKDEKIGCYILTSYKQSGSLEGVDYIYIDPTWANPYLVFWHKYSSEGSSYFGYLELTGTSELGWSQVKGFSGSNTGWVEEAIDLNSYKDQDIQFRFMYTPTNDQVSKTTTRFNFHEWYITMIAIVPDYNP